MWLNRIALICNLFLVLTFGTRFGNAIWPDCGNFAGQKGYPIGCKKTPYDLCAVESDECKELVCDVIKKEFTKCGDACNQNPGSSSIEVDELKCWCSRQPQKTCSLANAFSAFLPNSQRSAPKPKRSRRGGSDLAWGATVEIPGESLLPVFCSNKKDSCPGVEKSICQVGMCPDGMCNFENNCYYVASNKENPQDPCAFGKPAAIETLLERQMVFFLLTETRIANLESPKIVTAGFLPKLTTNLIWKGWDFPVDREIVHDVQINIKTYDQVLYLIQTDDHSGFGMSWGLERDTSQDLGLVICKLVHESEELCDTTTTTSENGGETTRDAGTTTTSMTSASTSETTTTGTTTSSGSQGTANPTSEATTSTRKEPTTTTSTWPNQTTTSETPNEETTSTFPGTTEATTSTFDPTTLTDLTSYETTTEPTTTEEITDAPTDPPPCSRKCIGTDQYDEVWHCCEQTACSHKCPLNANGSAFWVCGDSQFKSKWPNYDDCTSTWVSNLTILVEEEKVTSFTLIMDVDQYMQDSSIFGHEMTTALNFTKISLDMLVKEQEEAEDPPQTKLNQRKFLSEMAMGVIDKLLILSKPWEQLNEDEKIDMGRRMQLVSEIFGFSVTKKAFEIGDEYNMSCKWSHTHMEAQFLQHFRGENDGKVVQFPIISDPKKSKITITDIPMKFKRGMSINLEAVGTLIPMQFAEIMFPASLGDPKKKINAGMISMTLYAPKKEAIHKFESRNSVRVTFRHERKAKGPAYTTIRHELYPGEEPTAIQGTAKCVFWNESKGSNGLWDTNGCRLLNSSHWYTICECNHLSSFALLMDVHKYIAKDQIMEIVSIVFSSLSVISLALTLFVLHGLKGIQGERNSIGKHLCLCLMTGHLMALTVLDRSYFKLSQEMCVGVAVTLHYVFLAAFMWMAVEGHHLYRLVVRVFDSGRDLSRIYLVAGYGTPIIVVAITCIVTASLEDTGYANDELCWLSSPGYIWAFMGPVLFLTLLNLVVLVLAMRVAVTAGGQQKKSFMERVKTWIRGWFSLSALLGVTWIFGFFYIQWDHNFAYAFITLNGCQGIFIFLTRVVFNEQVKTAMRRGAKQRAMMKRFYSLAFKGRNSGSSFHPSSWFFGNSSSSQLDLTSSASTSYWANTTSRRRSSANHSANNDAISDAPTEIAGGQNFANNISLSGQQEHGKTSNAWLKRKQGREEQENNEPPVPSSNLYANDIQQIWSSLREADTLSEIPEEDYDDDLYEKMEVPSVPRKKSFKY